MLILQKLPANLEELEFGQCASYNQSLDHLPANLKSLTIGKCFQQPIKSLPVKLQKLHFWNGIHDAPISYLPPNLLLLELSERYNQPGIDDMLPPTLLHLHLGKAYDHPLKKLPPVLEHLCLGEKFSHVKSLPPLPETLRQITLYCMLQDVTNKWPQRYIMVVWFPLIICFRLYHLDIPEAARIPDNLPRLCHVNRVCYYRTRETLIFSTRSIPGVQFRSSFVGKTCDVLLAAEGSQIIIRPLKFLRFVSCKLAKTKILLG